ncbi:hypothetical protein [Roseivivax marinus]|uniref:hypothetical protein n=1 Tax=Roseivivax marinus TaxID=1379903 RepID=UPI00273F3A75|nr:hypothetical protein [Roseivivax marinus]
MSAFGSMRATPRLRPGRSEKRQVSIWELLVWAFHWERVSLDFDEISSTSGTRPGVGMEYILMQRHNLGCQVDGGGRSEAHPDADLVASAVAALPEGCGGRRMALWIAECARAGVLPTVPEHTAAKCEPVAWRRCKHGRFAERSFWNGDGRVARWPANHLGKEDGYVCLVTYSGTAREVAAQRRRWIEFRLALLELRETFRVCANLSAFEVSEKVPGNGAPLEA